MHYSAKEISTSASNAIRSFFCFGSSSTSNDAVLNSSISISFSCLRNPAFGEICGRTRTMRPSASFRDMPFIFIRYAATTVGDREMPAEQCTRIFPWPPFGVLEANAESMMSQAESTIFCIEDVAESVKERRWYVTDSTVAAGVVPMLRTCVMALDVRKGFDEAAEHGPR